MKNRIAILLASTMLISAILLTGCGWQASATERQRLRSTADTQIANAQRDATVGAAEANAAAKIGVARADADAREAEAEAEYKVEAERQWGRVESGRTFAYTMPILATILIVGLVVVAILFFAHTERTQAAQLATVMRALPPPQLQHGQALPPPQDQYGRSLKSTPSLDLGSMQALAAQHGQRIEVDGNMLYLVDNASGKTIDQQQDDTL